MDGRVDGGGGGGGCDFEVDDLVLEPGGLDGGVSMVVRVGVDGDGGACMVLVFGSVTIL